MDPFDSRIGPSEQSIKISASPNKSRVQKRDSTSSNLRRISQVSSSSYPVKTATPSANLPIKASKEINQSALKTGVFVGQLIGNKQDQSKPKIVVGQLPPNKVVVGKLLKEVVPNKTTAQNSLSDYFERMNSISGKTVIQEILVSQMKREHRGEVKSLNDLDQSIKMAKQFITGLPRATYILNGKAFYTNLSGIQKEQDRENVIYNTADSYIKALGGENGKKTFYGLSCLLNGDSISDFTIKVRKIKEFAYPADDAYPAGRVITKHDWEEFANMVLPSNFITDQYQVKILDHQVNIDIVSIFRLQAATDLLYRKTPYEAGELGYVSTKRSIVLSREDLAIDWSQEKDLSKVAPSLEVTDTISEIMDTPDKARDSIGAKFFEISQPPTPQVPPSHRRKLTGA